MQLVTLWLLLGLKNRSCFNTTQTCQLFSFPNNPFKIDNKSHFMISLMVPHKNCRWSYATETQWTKGCEIWTNAKTVLEYTFTRINQQCKSTGTVLEVEDCFCYRLLIFSLPPYRRTCILLHNSLIQAEVILASRNCYQPNFYSCNK